MMGKNPKPGVAIALLLLKTALEKVVCKDKKISIAVLNTETLYKIQSELITRISDQ